VKLLTDLQISGCELHKNAFGGRHPPGPAGGAVVLPIPHRRYKGEGREGRGRKGLRIGRGGRGEGQERTRRGMAGWEGDRRGGKGREDKGA